MPDGSDWQPEHVHATWAKFRSVFEALGISEHLAEIDELASNDTMMLGAQDTWRHRLKELLKRVEAAVATIPPERVRPALSAMHELCALTDHMEETRLADARRRVSSQRGVAYCQFLLAAQMKLQDPALSALAPFVPATVLEAADLELRDAAMALELERRMRALASATKTAMEAYYRPILKGVWTVSALMVGKRASNPPAEIGPLFRDLEQNFWPLLQIPWPTEFIDKDAKFVRNAAAHQSVRFDAATNELVLANRGREQRLTEQELRQRLGNMFERAETMRAAFVYATGQRDPLT